MSDWEGAKEQESHPRLFIDFMLARLFLLIIMVCCAGPISAQPIFTSEAGTRISSFTVLDVVDISGGYRMYLTSDSFRVLSATSADGINWNMESGVRLSTQTAPLNLSSITAAGVVYTGAASNGPWVMYYVGLSTDGFYSVLSATSSDGLAWSKQSGYRLQFNGGTSFVDTPRPYLVSASVMELYYVRDSGVANNPADYRAYVAESTDSAVSFTEKGELLSGATAYQVCVGTLSDSRVRLFYTTPLASETTASQVLSAISTDGLIFSKESNVTFSTTSAVSAISGIAVARSSMESYRWRLFSAMTVSGSTVPSVYSALTMSPGIDSVLPVSVYQSDPTTDFTVAGEIFSTTTPTVSISGPVVIPVISVTRNSDLKLTVSADPQGAIQGYYNLTVTNSDGRSVTLANAILVDYKPGFVNLTDNLFRPLRGESCTISVNIFSPGLVTVKLYTISGRLVKTLFKGVLPVGATGFTWSGDTDLGNTVASGLYLLNINGPKLDITRKIVVIK